MSFTMEWRLPPAGVHVAVIEEVDFMFKAVVWLIIVYHVQHEGEDFRLREMLALDAPRASADYFRTAEGKGRVKQILDAHGVPESAVTHFDDIVELLRGKAVTVEISHKKESGLKVPRVHAVLGSADIAPSASAEPTSDENKTGDQ
jgi:hypothetical protein